MLTIRFRFFPKRGFLSKFAPIILLGSFLLLHESGLPSQAATVEYVYDDLGRLVSVIYSNGTQFDYTYDDAGNRITHTEDDTGQAFPPEFFIEGGENYEGENVTFTIRKVGTTSQSHNVDYATASGTATQGTDYTGKSGTLTFSSSETSKTVSVSISSDSETEPKEDFYLDISNPTNGALIGDGRASGYIIDGAPPPPPNSPPNAQVHNITMDTNDTAIVNVTVGTDPDGDPVIVTSVNAGAGVSASISGDQKKVVIESGGFGGFETTVDYTIEDDGGLSDSSVINVTVNGGTCNFCSPNSVTPQETTQEEESGTSNES